MSDNLSAAFQASSGPSRGRALKRIADAGIAGVLSGVLRDASVGQLHVTLPSGRTIVVGNAGTSETSLVVANYAPFWKVASRGLLGVADAYISGDIETSDLHALFRFFLDNEQAVTARLPLIMRGSAKDAKYHSARANTREGSQRNIAEHYDLGNEFYRLWLDSGMSYSSGIYRRPDVTLENAQAEKHARIVEALELQPHHDVLEIGCGWGALLEELAARAARTTAITISEQQFSATRDRLAMSPNAERASVRFQDYRDVTGSFDRIASIEMIEAVGEDNWPSYFGTIANRLKPGGIAVLQAITLDPRYFDDYRVKPDFIQRYIFPGGMLPTVDLMREHAGRAGLELHEVETFGSSYALTLAEWRRRFDEAWPRVEALGFDERFRRMWSYYLTYCEVGFQAGTIDVGLYRLSKPV